MQPESSKGYQLSYKVFHDGALKHEERSSAESLTIGRAGSNVISLDDERVSDVHAVVKLTREKKLVLTDLGSDEGTFVDNERVDTRIQLKKRARIRVGSYEIVIDVIDPAAASLATTGEEDPSVKAQTDRLLDLSADDVVKILFKAWDSQDKLGVDNKSVPKVLELFEIWGDSILSARQYSKTHVQLVLADSSKKKPDYVVDREFLTTDHQPLLLYANGALQLCIRDNFGGEIHRGNTVDSISTFIANGTAKKFGNLFQIPISDDSRFTIRLGHIVLVGGFAFPAKKPVGANRQDVDPTFLGLFLFFMMIVGSGMAYLRTLPPPPELGIETLDDKFAKAILPKKQEKIEEKKIEVKLTKVESTPKPPEVEDRGKKETKVQISKAEKVALDQAAEDKKAAEKALAGLIGNQGFDRGFGPDMGNAVAGLLATTGRSNVSGITGSRGLGFGGGDGAGGVGQIGTKGGGGGDGYGSGYGIKKRTKENANIGVDVGDALVLGGLDKSVIERVIRDHLTQIRYCYQKELPKNPRLAGKVVTKFTIDKDGNVSQSSIKETSMNNAIVEDCVNGRILQLKFPKPRGGGIVTVSYPFFFKAAG